MCEIRTGPCNSVHVDISHLSSRAICWSLLPCSHISLWKQSICTVCSYPEPIFSFLRKYSFPLWSVMQMKPAKYSEQNDFSIQTLSNRKSNHQTQKALRIYKVDCPLYWKIMKMSWLIFTQTETYPSASCRHTTVASLLSQWFPQTVPQIPFK